MGVVYSDSHKNSCAFCGHRPRKLPWKYDEANRQCMALKAALARQTCALLETGYTQFLSGMAEGVDCYCAQIVLDLREKNPTIKLHCILPCKEQANKFPVSLRKTYNSILDQADSIVYVSRASHKNCMLDRNHFLLALAQIIQIEIRTVFHAQHIVQGSVIKHRQGVLEAESSDKNIQGDIDRPKAGRVRYNR